VPGRAFMQHCRKCFTIDETVQGRGIGTTAVKQFVGMLMDNTDLCKLAAVTSIDNFRSIALLRRVGFSLEGCLREHFVIDGRSVSRRIFWTLN
jgi:[ribosomal protein S5]-alanine N-acetyltransferase